MATSTRTDAHRPGAAEFDPQSYVYEAAGDYGTASERPVLREVNAAVRRLEAEGYQNAAHQSAGTCGHCGAWLRYFALLSHPATKEMILVGETCLDNRFERTQAEFQAMRRAAELDRAAQKARKAFDELRLANPGLERGWAMLEAAKAGDETYPTGTAAGAGWALATIADITRKARRYGDASAKQLAFVERLWSEVDEKLARHAEREAERAALPPVPPAPAGRVQVEGVITKAEWREDGFGGSVKITVLTDAGWRVWGTLPTNLREMNWHDVNGMYQFTPGAEKGDRVRFTATLTPSDDDPTFAFAKRPAGAEIVTRAS